MTCYCEDCRYIFSRRLKNCPACGGPVFAAPRTDAELLADGYRYAPSAARAAEREQNPRTPSDLDEIRRQLQSDGGTARQTAAPTPEPPPQADDDDFFAAFSGGPQRSDVPEQPAWSPDAPASDGYDAFRCAPPRPASFVRPAAIRSGFFPSFGGMLSGWLTWRVAGIVLAVLFAVFLWTQRAVILSALFNLFLQLIVALMPLGLLVGGILLVFRSLFRR